MSTSNSKCGLSPHERESFLREHGFEHVRTGKGSHAAWENADLKLLARSHAVTMPANLASNDAQRPWEITLPDNPASGTWRTIVKQVEWAQKTAREIEGGSAHEQQRCDLMRQFRKAAAATREWEKAVKHHLKAGLPRGSVPSAPADYRQLETLKGQLFKP